MASSGTFSFSPDNSDFLDEAFERIQLDPAKLTGRHTRSAMMSIDLLLSDWATLGVRLFQVDEQTQTVTDGTASYAPASGTLAILEGIIRRSGIDTTVHRITRESYYMIPDKTTEGLPTQVWLDRAASLYWLWQVPENSTDVFRYRRLRRIQDAGTGQLTPDLPVWWFEAFASGLAAKLAGKFKPELEDKRIAQAARAIERALHEDRERGDTTFGMSG